MDAERWQKIERIFHAALQAEPGHRSAILDDSCQDDESLRSEVESLLAHHENAGPFIETPAFAARDPKLGPAQASSNSERAAPVAPGVVIAQYRVLEKIGAGGMGVVYKAEDLKLGRLAALKFLPETPATDASALERFRREARAASALNHTNICTIYDIEEFEGHPFIAMEYLEGRTLADRILGRPLENDEISKFGIQVAEALSAAHSKGVVHRDVKPGNIFVTDAGLVKVLDFGLAKLVGLQGKSAPTKSLTESHTVTGTLPYMSPEQLRGREVDARTDIYALGIVLYEMATGRRPFTSDVSPQLIDDILNSLPAPPQQVNSKISPRLEEIILKCLEKDPRQRYQAAAEVKADLQELASGAAQVRVVRVSWPRQRSTLAVATGALAVMIVGTLIALNVGGLRGRLLGSPKSPIVESLAVLPLQNLSGDPQQDYIADGITEGVIDKLSEIPDFKVMSRNSVFRFKGKEADARVAGRDLKVQAVLTGRITRQTDVLTVSAELVNVSDGIQIWGRQLRYTGSDLARIQDDLATAVSNKLQLRLSGTEENRLAKRVTENADAYQLYLQARYLLSQRIWPDIQKSLELFQQAIQKDPNFALAYAGLADAHNISNVLNYVAPKESSLKAEAAAKKALALDPQLGEAHAALGLVKSHYDLDFPGAQQEFLKAIELNPNYPYAYMFYATAYLAPMGRHQEAIAEMKKALELDPLSVLLNSLLGTTYMWAGDFEKARQQFQHTMEVDPTSPLPYVSYVALLEAMGKYEEAMQQVEKAQLLSGAPAADVTRGAREFHRAFQTGGPMGYWRKNLELAIEGQKLSGLSYFPPFAMAVAYARVGDKENAFRWLEKSYEERDGGSITLVRCDPNFNSLHGDPRFAELLRRMGLPSS